MSWILLLPMMLLLLLLYIHIIFFVQFFGSRARITAAILRHTAHIHTPIPTISHHSCYYFNRVTRVYTARCMFFPFFYILLAFNKQESKRNSNTQTKILILELGLQQTETFSLRAVCRSPEWVKWNHREKRIHAENNREKSVSCNRKNKSIDVVGSFVFGSLIIPNEIKCYETIYVIWSNVKCEVNTAGFIVMPCQFRSGKGLTGGGTEIKVKWLVVVHHQLHVIHHRHSDRYFEQVACHSLYIWFTLITSFSATSTHEKRKSNPCRIFNTIYAILVVVCHLLQQALR